ncbi:glycosyltransferase family 2 protein [Psychrobacter sp. Ps2]|uniref:glycosyltransferase family A protein n=1 Tax=Psychrobacter sp. Ps2 TaxID=2790956 RepID=UPI001EDD1965|nr:glycosyltransferase family 2 protein [Psychrobacter sp. Ps2]MCG3859939.1 glycosyltransferase family 2 protein [Psychrobacter sp. Ps2]
MSDSVYITVGIPFYNAEKYLEDAICSVIAQTHKKWELILINDGSNDKSLDIAVKYSLVDKRIRVISDGVNKKLPNRLNQIIQESNYDFIARMDADDLMSNDRLEKQLKILKNNKEIDFVTTGCLTIGKDNELTGVSEGRDYQMSAANILEGVTNILHASLLARKNWYIRNQYNETIVQAEDFDLWLQAAKNNDLNYIVIKDPLYWYRVVENVTIEKIVNGYNAQIEIINNNYDGVIFYISKYKIIKKFKIKKVIVKSLDTMGLLKILLKRRSNRYNKEQLDYYNDHFTKIQSVRVQG